ncbi:ankyrin repeat domain-containing protein 49 [Dermatophagoides farinae]|nr:ankyrin repeat domain-containing protein 49-like [Dermatophagoides farinae]KAH7643144.1 ankyrin repeat domain containing protein [Dermatophagoides farinae]
MLGAFVLGDENFDNDDIDINDSNEMNKDNPIYQLRLLDPNHNDGQMLNVFEAAEKGSIELMKQFQRMDPELINSHDSEGYTPLHRACYQNQIDMVKWLIMNGANVCARTNDGWQPIHSTAHWGHTKILRILLAYGANINSRTNGGNTPFHLAAMRANSNRHLIEYLLYHPDIDHDIRNDANDTIFDVCKRNSMLYKLWNLL